MRVSTMAMAGVVILGVVASGCGSSEKCDVTISYVLEPTEGLPEGLAAVAINDAGVKVDGSEDDDRAKKWATISANRMESLIQDAAKKYGSPIQIASRRQTKQVMAEKDLMMAGLAEGGAAAQAAKLLNVQAIIGCQLDVRVEVKKSESTTHDITSLFGGGGRGWGYGGGTMSARDASAIARNITVQCKYNMIDAANGEAIFDYTRMFCKMDSKKPSPFFGRSKGEADLDPVDEYIGELVLQGMTEFVSKFVPCEVTYSYELASRSGEGSADGILALRADDYERAVSLFQAALADDPKDHRSVFALGVTSELTGDWDGALTYYRRSVGMPGLDEDEQDAYVAAKDRVNDHKDRIRQQ